MALGAREFHRRRLTPGMSLLSIQLTLMKQMRLCELFNSSTGTTSACRQFFPTAHHTFLLMGLDEIRRGSWDYSSPPEPTAPVCTNEVVVELDRAIRRQVAGMTGERTSTTHLLQPCFPTGPSLHVHYSHSTRPSALPPTSYVHTMIQDSTFHTCATFSSCCSSESCCSGACGAASLSVRW
jgi:hypothetical protein